MKFKDRSFMDEISEVFPSVTTDELVKQHESAIYALQDMYNTQMVVFEALNARVDDMEQDLFDVSVLALWNERPWYKKLWYFFNGIKFEDYHKCYAKGNKPTIKNIYFMYNSELEELGCK